MWAFRHWQLPDGQIAGVTSITPPTIRYYVRFGNAPTFRPSGTMSGGCRKVAHRVTVS
jgi:hypothetical protein